jgi:AraC family transcriptional activator of tynA and feaB
LREPARFVDAAYFAEICDGFRRGWGAHMKTVYSTRGFAGDRSALWRSVIRDVYAHLEIDVAPGPEFSGHITRAQLGQIEITDVRTDSEIAQRKRRHISGSATDAYIYLLVKTGHLCVTQFGRRCMIAPGQYALLDLDEPYEFNHPAPVHKVGLKLPHPLLRRSAGEIASLCAIPHSAASGIARLAADYISGLTDPDVDLSDDQSYLVSRTASDLVFLSLEANTAFAFADESAVRAAIRRRALAYVEANHAKIGLRPETVAAALKVSLRYLHQCFEPAERSVMQQIKKIRLDRAFAALEDPTLRHHPVSQIAIRNGFGNVSHFSDAFRTQFGRTPRDVRSRGKA